METTDLTTLLPLANGTLLFTAETVPDTALAAQLSNLTGNLPFTIRNATRTLENNTVRVSGLVNVLGQLDLPVTLSAAVVPSPALLQLRAVIQLQSLKKPPLLQDFWQRLRLPNPQKDTIPKELALNDLMLEADKTGSFRLEATMAPAPGWPLALGPAKLQLANVKLTVQNPSGVTTSRLSGELALGEALTLAMDCDTTGSFSLGAKLPSTTLRQLVKSVTRQELPAVGLFDTSFEGGSVAICREKDGLLLTATGTADGIGLVVQARQNAGAWGLALGLSLVDKVPIKLSALEQIRQLCRLSSMLVVFTSYDKPGVPLASLVAPGSPAAGAPLALSGGLKKGLTAYASWRPGTDDKLRLLRKLLPQELAVLLHLNSELTGGSLAAGVSFAFNNKTDDNPLTFRGEVGYELEAGSTGLFLSGSMQTKLPGQPGQPDSLVEFDVEAEFLPTGLLISGSMLGTAPIPFSLLPVSLSNLAVVVGLNEASVPSLGLAGSLAVDVSKLSSGAMRGFQSSVAVFFDSTNPARSLLAGSVSNLNLLDVLTIFTPQASMPDGLVPVLKSVALTGTTSIALPDGSNELATSLAARQLGKLADALRPQGTKITSDITQALLVAGGAGTWFLTDVSSSPPVHYDLSKQGNTLTVRVNPQLYFAPQDTQLGHLQFGQGLFINAKLQILTFEALVNIQLSLDKGLLVEGAINKPIVVGHEQFFSLTAESDPLQGARVSVATYSTTYTPSPPEIAAAQAELQAWQQASQDAQNALTLANMEALRQKALNAVRLTGRGGPQAQAPRPPVLGPRPSVPVQKEVAPHFLLDGKVTILGLRTGIYVEVNQDGLAFLIDDTPQRGVYIQLGGSVKGVNNLTATGTLTVGLDKTTIGLGQLGSVTLDTNVQGKLDLAVKAAAFSTSAISTARFAGTAQVLGQQVGFTLLFQVTGPSPLSLQQQIVAALTTTLNTIFLDSQAWLSYVWQGLVQGVPEASKVLVDVYKLGQNRVLALYQQAGANDEQVGAALKNTFGVVAPDEAAKVLQNANFKASLAQGVLQSTYKVAGTEAAAMLAKAGFSPTDIASALSATGNTLVETGKDGLNQAEAFGKSVASAFGIRP
ncbi:MAG: hypothetical protein ACRYFZ_11020 [Janthinobacterium lividum]